MSNYRGFHSNIKIDTTRETTFCQLFFTSSFNSCIIVSFIGYMSKEHQNLFLYQTLLASALPLNFDQVAKLYPSALHYTHDIVAEEEKKPIYTSIDMQKYRTVRFIDRKHPTKTYPSDPVIPRELLDPKFRLLPGITFHARENHLMIEMKGYNGKSQPQMDFALFDSFRKKERKHKLIPDTDILSSSHTITKLPLSSNGKHPVLCINFDNVPIAMIDYQRISVDGVNSSLYAGILISPDIFMDWG